METDQEKAEILKKENNQSVQSKLVDSFKRHG